MPSPPTWPSSSTRTPPSPRPLARHFSRWRASRCITTANWAEAHQGRPHRPRATVETHAKNAKKELREAMSVSVSMPQLGESVTEGTVTRWLKREGEHVQADEPLLEVSTDKVDTEIPSPVSGVLRGITVAEDETVAVGAELAVIDEDGAAGGQADNPAEAPAPQQQQAPAPEQPAAPSQPAAAEQPPAAPQQAEPEQPAPVQAPAAEAPAAQAPPAEAPPAEPPPAQATPAVAYEQPPAYQPPGPAPAQAASFEPPEQTYDNGQAGGFTDGGDGPYVTPLVRKLAAEHEIDLAAVTGTGVGGRIRKQDILDAAAVQRGIPPAAG